MRKAGRIRRWPEVLLLLAGVMGIAIWAWSHVRMAVFQTWANRVLERRTGPRRAAHPRAKTQPAIENGALLGRLVIPRLSLRAVVREGDGADTLDVALGHIPGTALPGQPGNVGVAGHRDTLFRGLRRIAKNDTIQFQTPAGDYRYEVESTAVVKPQDVGVLGATRDPEMTLVTCYPFHYVGPAPDRFIVKARLVTPPAPEKPAPPVRHGRPPVSRPTGAGSRRVDFRVAESHSRELLPGILLGISWTDAASHRANGWLWLADEHRTIWLRNQAARQPVFFGGAAGGRHELMITGITRNGATGYLLRPPGDSRW